MPDPHTSRIFPKKYLGQNFLIDQRVIERIVTAIAPTEEDCIVEIGPGPGALTKALLPRAGHYIGVETDGELCQQLRQSLMARNAEAVADAFAPDVTRALIHQDFLKFNFQDFPEGVKLIGNLPYNISTPILEKVIAERAHLREAFFTVQWEFGQRLAAKVGSKDYGSLSCFVQYHADTRILFKIPPQAFRPQPKVTSCFLHLNFRPPPYPAGNEEALFRLIRQAFSQRRKKISNALSTIFSEEILIPALETAHLDPRLRAEDLSVKNYVDLANALAKKVV